MEMIQVYKCEHHDKQQVMQIEKDITAFQKIVDGDIQFIKAGKYAIAVDEEGRTKGARPSVWFDVGSPIDYIAGTSVWTKLSPKGAYQTLTDEDITLIKRFMLGEPLGILTA